MAQKKAEFVNPKYIEIKSAKKLVFDEKMGGQRLLGNVIFSHENVLMHCDSAHLFDSNTVDAFSHIVIKQGDSLLIKGDKLHYDGNTKLAVLNGDVTCIEKDMTLSTSILSYDLSTSTASYFSGGTIQSKDNTLTSRNGYYHSPSKTMSFRYSVKLKNPKYTMQSDTLQYNTNLRTAYFMGTSIINFDSTQIKTDLGWYSTVQEKCKLLKNCEVISGNQILRGDSLFYDRKIGHGLVLGHVFIIDTLQHATIVGKNAEYWDDRGLSIVTGKALYTQYFKKDTLFMASDTLYSLLNKKSGGRILRSYYNCKFFSHDMAGISDSVVYTTEDSSMILYHAPILWNGESQLSAKKIVIKTGKKKLYGFILIEEAFVIEKKDTTNFNQIKGRNIEGVFTNNQITSIFVSGNAQAIYFLEQKKKIIGVNKTECSEMTIKTDSTGINEITFKKHPSSTVYPMDKVDIEELKLKGFKWSQAIRPRCLNDLYSH